MADLVLAALIAYAALVGVILIWLHIRHVRLEEAHARLELEAKRDEQIDNTLKRLTK